MRNFLFPIDWLHLYIFNNNKSFVYCDFLLLQSQFHCLFLSSIIVVWSGDFISAKWASESFSNETIEGRSEVSLFKQIELKASKLIHRGIPSYSTFFQWKLNENQTWTCKMRFTLFVLLTLANKAPLALLSRAMIRLKVVQQLQKLINCHQRKIVSWVGNLAPPFNIF